jgi:hypothetical protein
LSPDLCPVDETVTHTVVLDQDDPAAEIRRTSSASPPALARSSLLVSWRRGRGAPAGGVIKASPKRS